MAPKVFAPGDLRFISRDQEVKAQDTMRAADSESSACDRTPRTSASIYVRLFRQPSVRGF